MRTSIYWITILSINKTDEYPFYISGNVTHSVYISSLDLPHSVIPPLCQIPSKLKVKLSSEAKSNEGFYPTPPPKKLFSCQALTAWKAETEKISRLHFTPVALGPSFIWRHCVKLICCSLWEKQLFLANLRSLLWSSSLFFHPHTHNKKHSISKVNMLS